jgi:hypothetical protein
MKNPFKKEPILFLGTMNEKEIQEFKESLEPGTFIIKPEKIDIVKKLVRNWNRNRSKNIH